MTVPKSYEMEEGEYLRIPVYVDADATPPWNDLSVVTGISMTLMRDAADATPITAGGTLDLPGDDGRVRGCGAVVPTTAPSGFYNGQIELAGTGGGWPQKFRFTLLIYPKLA